MYCFNLHVNVVEVVVQALLERRTTIAPIIIIIIQYSPGLLGILLERREE